MVAEDLGLVYPQQHLGAGRQVHIEAEGVTGLQAAPAWRQAGVQLIADITEAGVARSLALARQHLGLAHQLHDPGVGGDGIGEYLRLLPQALLAALLGQALQFTGCLVTSQLGLPQSESRLLPLLLGLL